MDSSIRVLHVDDSPDFLDVSTTVLEQTDERFTVTTATSAGERLDRLDDNIDCIVSDCENLFKADSLATGTTTRFGLAIVQEVVAAHGWEIHVGESEAGGARFEITGVESEE